MTIAIFGGGDIANNGIGPVLMRLGHKVIIIDHEHTDVRNYDHVHHDIEYIQPQVVIVTAGVSHVATIADGTPEDWLEELTTNLFGSYTVAKAAVDCGVKTLIFMASVAGKYGKPNHSGYSASKGGVISLVQSLGLEGHDAYAISPGRVHTKMREHDYPGEDIRTRLMPEQIGDVVVEILKGKHTPGDNLIIRKIGFTPYRRVDKGEPWKKYLKVGEPPVR